MAGINRFQAEQRLTKKEQNEINSIVEYISSNLQNRGKVVSFIENHIEDIFKNFLIFGATNLLATLEKNDFLSIKNETLEEMKIQAMLVKLMKKMKLTMYLPNLMEQKGALKKRINVIFNDFQDKDEIIQLIPSFERDFNVKKKKAESMYSSALNEINEQKRLALLGKALRVAPWGSIISFKIIKASILIFAGEFNKGKNEISQKKEKLNIVKQSAL